MSRKRKNKKPLGLYLVTILLVALGLLGFLTSRSILQQRLINTPKTATDSANLLTQESTPSPTPDVYIPAQMGRSFHLPVLTYHYIRVNLNKSDQAGENLSVSPDNFEAQMNYLVAQGFSTVTFDTLYGALSGQASLPAKSVILTFDDGYTDFYYTAYPILKRYNLHATSFIPTALIGGSYYLTWEQIKEMDQSGLISFQAHSVNHVNLNSLDPTRLDYQLIESKRVLEQQLGKSVNTFAYPYGLATRTVQQMTKKAGFIGAVGTWSGSIQSEGTVFNMPRIKISNSYSLEQFTKLVI